MKDIEEDFNEVEELKFIRDQEKSLEDFDKMFGYLKKVIYNSSFTSFHQQPNPNTYVPNPHPSPNQNNNY